MNKSLLIAYLRLLRITAVFTAMSNILAAHFIATQGQFAWGLLFQLLAISSLLYSAGMVLNDCFDLELDRRERPARPLPSGAIPIHHAWWLGWLLLGLALLIAIWSGTTVFALTSLLAVLIIAYNAYFKNTLFASLNMAACRYFNWILGLSVSELSINAYLLPLPVLIYIYALTRVSQIETRADSKRPLIICMVGMGLVVGLTVAFYFLSVYTNPWMLVFLLAAFTVVINKILKVYHHLDSPSVQNLVRFLIFGIIPLDALLVYANGPWWGALLILLLFLPGRFFGRMISVT